MPRITIGPHWPMYICLSTAILVKIYLYNFKFKAVSCLIVSFVAIKKGYIATFTTTTISLFVYFSYTIAALKNPGIVTKLS